MKSIVEDIIKKNNKPTGETFEFKSSDHIRYQNGIDVSGHNSGCNRTIRIEKNTNGGEGYTITIFNDDSIHPFWGNNIQMAPKQMKIIRSNKNLIHMRGYGFDIMGNNFSDYGLSLEFCSGKLLSCTLHLFDRNIEIKYFN